MKDGLISVDEACARLRAVGYLVSSSKLQIFISNGQQLVDQIEVKAGRVNPDRVKEIQMLRRRS